MLGDPNRMSQDFIEWALASEGAQPAIWQPSKILPTILSALGNRMGAKIEQAHFGGNVIETSSDLTPLALQMTGCVCVCVCAGFLNPDRLY